MKLCFTPRATQDLIDIAEHISAANPAAALRVRETILDSLQLLIAFPALGRDQAVEGVRKHVTRKYHTIDRTAQEITILTIQHPAREQPRIT